MQYRTLGKTGFSISEISLGTWQHKMWDDDWTAVTSDGKRTAQFEHTLVVTDDGVEVLTGGPGAA